MGATARARSRLKQASALVTAALSVCNEMLKLLSQLFLISQLELGREHSRPVKMQDLFLDFPGAACLIISVRVDDLLPRLPSWDRPTDQDPPRSLWVSSRLLWSGMEGNGVYVSAGWQARQQPL